MSIIVFYRLSDICMLACSDKEYRLAALIHFAYFLWGGASAPLSMPAGAHAALAFGSIGCY